MSQYPVIERKTVDRLFHQFIQGRMLHMDFNRTILFGMLGIAKRDTIQFLQRVAES